MTLWSQEQARTAHASNYASFGYTALGDSITADDPTIDPTFSARYVGAFASHVGTVLGVPVSVTDQGIPGYTSGGLAYKLASDPTFQASVKNANLVTVMIGINDYGFARALYLQGTCGGADNQDCIRTIESNFRDNFTSIISQITALANPNVIVLASDVYNPFIDADLLSGNSAVFLPLISQINADIHTIAAAKGLAVAGVYLAFNGATGLESPNAKGYTAPDGVHPSALGHQVIATQFGNLDNSLLSADSDGDGFSNKLEIYLGTDILSSCPRNSSDPAFPPDAHNSGRVGMFDFLTVLRAYGKDSTSPDWASTYRRFDFHQDGRITAIDVMIELRYFGRSGC